MLSGARSIPSTEVMVGMPSAASPVSAALTTLDTVAGGLTTTIATVPCCNGTVAGTGTVMLVELTAVGVRGPAFKGPLAVLRKKFTFASGWKFAPVRVKLSPTTTGLDRLVISGAPGIGVAVATTGGCTQVGVGVGGWVALAVGVADWGAVVVGAAVGAVVAVAVGLPVAVAVGAGVSVGVPVAVAV